MRTGPFQAGDAVIFVDQKARRYFTVLKEGGRKDIRGQVFQHDDIIGQPGGISLDSDKGKPFTIVRATLPDYVVQMPRYATVIYPKDLATILLWGDIGPGLKCLEAGLGSAGLALALLRAIGSEGHLTSYDVRTEAINRGKKNVEAFFGAQPENHTIKVADVYAGIDETELDRIILDVPEPWQVVPHAARALKPGGIFVAYSPTVLQVDRTGEALRRERAFTDLQTTETLMRPWFVSRASVRPELQMIGHTGFLTFARCIVPPPQKMAEEAAEEAETEVAEPTDA
ncbi:MAG: SAM-dependent methyltransferase [Deltaproteobacteria bacterium]|nr:SAM-dependent methyltransferase [Deltaproteobacteria bacterium]